jgi:hypothetical protein
MQAHLFDPGVYGAVFGLSGLFNYAASAVLSLLAMRLLSGFGSVGFQLVFGASFALSLGALFAAGKLTPLPSPQARPAAASSKGKAVLSRQTLLISAMHALRGLSSGVYFFIIPIGYRFYSLSLADAGMLSFLGAVAGASGYMGIYKFLDKFGPAKASVFCLGLEAAAIAPLFAFRSPGVFMASYFIYNIGHLALSQIIPIGVLQTTPPESMAMTTAIRLIIMSLADAAASLAAGAMIELFLILLALMCAMKAVKAVVIVLAFGQNGRQFQYERDGA